MPVVWVTSVEETCSNLSMYVFQKISISVARWKQVSVCIPRIRWKGYTRRTVLLGENVSGSDTLVPTPLICPPSGPQCDQLPCYVPGYSCDIHHSTHAPSPVYVQWGGGEQCSSTQSDSRCECCNGQQIFLSCNQTSVALE